MKTQIELPPDMQEKLQAEAERQGQDPDTLVISLVDAWLHHNSPQSLGLPAEDPGQRFEKAVSAQEEAERFRRWADGHPRRGGPILSLEAMSRESIYEERG